MALISLRQLLDHAADHAFGIAGVADGGANLSDLDPVLTDAADAVGLIDCPPDRDTVSVGIRLDGVLERIGICSWNHTNTIGLYRLAWSRQCSRSADIFAST